MLTNIEDQEDDSLNKKVEQDKLSKSQRGEVKIYQLLDSRTLVQDHFQIKKEQQIVSENSPVDWFEMY